ncbi:hypothetical protein MSPP1_002099 [Malassezia sp. CBS 17886]|nr:hypothetical protein MSPP1_002099 [Malassezia sp. CBS 17886]
MAVFRGGAKLNGSFVRAHANLLHGARTRNSVLHVGAAVVARAGLPPNARAFSLRGVDTSSGNESARKALLQMEERVHDGASHAENAGSTALEDVRGAATSVQERLVVAEETAATTSTDVIHRDLEAVEHASDMATHQLHDLGLGGWSPSGMLQHLLDSTQFLTSLPWWATIVLVTCGIRLSIAPLLVYVQGNSIRLSNIQPQMQGMMQDLEYAKSTGNQQEMQAAAVRVRKLMTDNNCSPFRSLLLPVVQMPIFLSFFFALDGLAKAKLPALTTGGFAWISDLTVADPYYVLPITSSLMTLLVLETGAETGTTGMNQTPQARMVKNVLRAVTVLAAWFVSGFPAAVLLYWTTTNTFSLVQLLALRTRSMKRLLRLPERIQHPPKPHVREKTFMEGLRSGMTSQSALPNASRARAAPSSLSRRNAEHGDGALSTSRKDALNSILTEGSAAPASSASQAARAEVGAEKQARVAAARERRLRQKK